MRAEMLEDPFAIVGTRLEGRYDIEAMVAQGGFGVVYRGCHRAIDRAIALKVLKDPASLGDPARVTAVRLLDFGIAKEMDVDERVGSGVTSTASALLAFSIAYVAPEQVSAARTGPWTDVHGLALILSEMLTDAAPFRGVDRMEIQLQVMSPERPTPAREGVDVGPLEPVLAKALKLRPAERYATVAELLAAVTAAAQGTVSRPRRSRATAKRLPTFPASFPVWSDDEPATLPLTSLKAPPIPPTEPVVAEQTVAAPPPARRPRPRGAHAQCARGSPPRSSRCSPRSPPPSLRCGVRPLLRRRGAHAPWWSPRGSSPSSMLERTRRPRRPPRGAHRHARRLRASETSGPPPPRLACAGG